MQRLMRIFSICVTLCLFASASMAAPSETQMAASVQNYFSGLFNKLDNAASQHPTPDTFRSIMKPEISDIEGLYGATLIDDSFVIQQVYFKRNFLARGFDLKKVKELEYFWDRMRTAPSPQLSEPGHGSIAATETDRHAQSDSQGWKHLGWRCIPHGTHRSVSQGHRA